MTYTYKKILSQAKTCQSNVKKEYKTGMTSRWSYYFAKAIVAPKKDVKKISFKDANDPKSTHISRQLEKAEYITVCKKLIAFVESNKRLPNYVSYKSFKLSPHLLTEFLSRILVFYAKNNRMPTRANINSKVFTKPLEPSNEVYKYFVKVFGSFDNTVDGFLKKIKERGYDYYYDDRYSNKECIDRLKKGLGINCTDSCQMGQNIIQQLVDWGKYKKVEALHVDCSSGGHIKLRITKNDGSVFIRDVACVISKNDKPISCVWCTNHPKAVNPRWYLSNLHR